MIKIKTLIVILLWSGILFISWPELKHYWQSSQLPVISRTFNSLKVLFDIPIQQPQEVNKTNLGRSGQTPDQPYNLDQSILELANYQKASQVAQQFNLSTDTTRLNIEFLNQVNQYRNEMNLGEVKQAPYLKTGARLLMDDLMEFHYFSNHTAQGVAFHQLHDIEDAPYRLSQFLYEMNVSVDDIRLKTWENPKIFSDFIVSVYPDALKNDFAFQWLEVQASPTDYLVDDASYVRLVFILITDSFNVSD